MPRFEMRCTDSELVSWRKAARSEKKPVAEWIKGILCTYSEESNGPSCVKVDEGRVGGSSEGGDTGRGDSAGMAAPADQGTVSGTPELAGGVGDDQGVVLPLRTIDSAEALREWYANQGKNGAAEGSAEITTPFTETEFVGHHFREPGKIEPRGADDIVIGNGIGWVCKCGLKNISGTQCWKCGKKR